MRQVELLVLSFCFFFSACRGVSEDAGIRDSLVAKPSLHFECPPRDAALLTTENLAAIGCVLDDNCPMGAYCDLVQRTCATDCVSGAPQDALDCPEGQACNCRGRCQSTQGALPVRPRRAVRIFPAALRLARDADDIQYVDLDVDPLADAGASDEAPPSDVVAKASESLQLSCDAGRSWGSRCAPEGWKTQENLLGPRSKKTRIAVRRSAAKGPLAEAAEVRIVVPDGVAPLHDIAVEETASVTLEDGVYEVAATPWDTSDTAQPSALRARVQGDVITLLDDGQVEFLNGDLSFSRSLAGVGAFLWAQFPGSVMAGKSMVSWISTPPMRSRNGALLTARLTLRVPMEPREQGWDLQFLRRVEVKLISDRLSSLQLASVGEKDVEQTFVHSLFRQWLQQPVDVSRSTVEYIANTIDQMHFRNSIGAGMEFYVRENTSAKSTITPPDPRDQVWCAYRSTPGFSSYLKEGSADDFNRFLSIFSCGHLFSSPKEAGALYEGCRPSRFVLKEHFSYAPFEFDSLTFLSCPHRRTSAERLCDSALHVNALEYKGLSSTLSTMSSDLLCSDGQPQRSFAGLFEAATRLPRTEMLRQCLDDLQAIPESFFSGNHLDISPSSSRGFAAEYFWPSLNAAVSQATEPASGHVLTHLLSQWLQAHQILAQDYLAQQQLIDALDAPSPERLPHRSEVESAIGAGLGLMLDTRVEHSLDEISAEVLLVGDYRQVFAPDVVVEPVKSAVAVHMLEASIAYLEMLTSSSEQILRESQAIGEQSTQAIKICAQRHSAMRDALGAVASIHSLAQRLHEKASTLHLPVAWESHYRGAEQRLVRARGQLLSSMGRLAGQKSQADASLPLYFVDVSGTNARFFAGSDYLLQRFATGAVQQVSDLYHGTLRNRADALLNQSQHEERSEEDFAQRYGHQLVRLCGETERGAAELLRDVVKGGVKLAQCHVRPGCTVHAGGNSTSCLRGEVGDAIAMVEAARQDIALTRSHFEDSRRRFELQMQSCAALEQSLSGDYGLMESHSKNVATLRNWKLASDHVANVAEGARSIFNVVDLIFTFGASAGAEGMATAARAASLQLQHEIESAGLNLNLSLGKREFDRRVAACLHEGQSLAIGLKTSSTTVVRRTLDLEAALRRVAATTTELRNTADEATAILGRQSKGIRPSAMTRTWFHQDLERYAESFAWAKRLVGMAAQAGQYEMQKSLELDMPLHLARRPNDLEVILRNIERERLPRAVHGRRPEEHKRTLSVRDDLLQLADQPHRSGTAAERFAAYLPSSHAAIYDEAGAYLGQGVRFSLAPAGKHECAERLWSVKAILQGTFANDAPVFTPLKLYKARTFASQWCEGSRLATDQPLQVNSIAPLESSREPVAGGLVPTSAFSQASLEARRDVSKARFADQAFAEGASEALAGQGLYGDYVVVLPPHATLPAAQVTDVILRFDYLSIG